MAIIDLDSPATSGNIIDLDAPTPARPAESGLMATIGGGFKQMVRAAGAEADLLQGDLPELQQAAREQQARVKDPRLQAFEADLQARRERLGTDPGWLDVIGEVGGAAWKNPAGAGLMVAEQLPNAAAVMGGGAAGALAGSALGPVGTVAGGVAGMFAGNVAIEGGSKALEHVARTDALSDDDRGRLIKEGAVKAGVITGVDALTFGASKWITGTARRAAEVATLRVAEQNGVAATEIAARRAADPAFNAAITSAEKLAVDGANTLGQRALQTGAALALETVGEGAGEYLGEFAATGEADKMDAVIEAFSSLGQSAAEVVVAKALSRPRTITDITKPDATLEQSIAAAAAVVDGAGDPLGAAIAGVADQRTQLAEGDAALALGDTDQPVVPPVTLPTADAAEIQRQNALGMMTPRSGTGLAPDAALPIVGTEPSVAQPLATPEAARSPAWYAQIAELAKMDDTVLARLSLSPEQQTAIATARSTPAGTIEIPTLAKTAGGQAEIERAKLAERSIATVRAEEAAQAELAAQPAQPTGMPPTTAPAAPSTALVPATTYAVGPDGVAAPVPSQPVTEARGGETTTVPSQVSVRYEQNPSGTQILTLTPKGVENLDAIRATLTAAGIKTAASKRTESGVVLQVSKKTDAAAVRNAIQTINAQYSTERDEAELANQEFQDVETDSTTRTEAPSAPAADAPAGPLRTVAGPDAEHIRTMLKLPADQQVAVVAPHTLPTDTEALKTGRMSVTRARTITQLAGMLGRKVQFFEGSHQISEGIYAQGDTLYLNVDSKVDALAVAGHEFTHSLRKTSPELYDKAHKAVVAMLRANGRRAVKYRKYYHGDKAKGKSAEDIAHELLADIGGNEWRSGEFWTDVFAEVDAQHTPKEARTIITRLRDAIVAFIDKLIRATPKKGFALEGVGFTRDELKEVRDLVVKAAAEAYLQTERTGGMVATEGGVAQESPARLATSVQAADTTGVIVGAKPGAFSWTPQSNTTLWAKWKKGDAYGPLNQGDMPPPFGGPTQRTPNQAIIGEAVFKILKSKGAQAVIKDILAASKVPLTPGQKVEVLPTQGSWLGQPERSFKIVGLTFEQSDVVSKIFGFATAQDMAIVTEPIANPAPDTYVNPGIAIGNGKKFDEGKLKPIIKAAQNEGIDYTVATDGYSVQFGYGSWLPFSESEFIDKVGRIAAATGMTSQAYEARTKANFAGSYRDAIERITGSVQGQGNTDAAAGPSDLFTRTVDNILIPYARAVGGQGYRFSPDLFAERFNLGNAEREYIRSALRPKSGYARSTAKIVSENELAGREPKADEELLVVGKSSGTAKKPVSNNSDVFWALQNRAALTGLIEPGDYSAEAQKLIAQAIEDEIAFHVSRPEGKSAIGWYDAALAKAKKIYHQVFPELDTNPDREMLFDALLGITSQGNDVHANSVFAGRMYYLITRENMTISQAQAALTGTFGEQSKAIENNFLKLEQLLKVNGYDRMRKIFNKQGTVGELNATLRADKDLYYKGEPLEITGLAEQTVRGWMVFGPKIGSFINNLHGDYSTLTADLWFSRTWNRILGFSFLHTPAQEAPKYQAFKEAQIAEYEKTTDAKKINDKGVRTEWDHGEDLQHVSAFRMDSYLADPEEMLRIATKIEELFRTGVDFNGKKTKGYSTKSDLRRAAKNWIEHRYDAVQLPRADAERAFQQKVMETAQKHLKKRYGITITIADMQAALWYHEKELFNKFGTGDSKSDPADYEDAAKKFMQKYNDGDLFYVEKPTPRYIRGSKSSYAANAPDTGPQFSSTRSEPNATGGGSVRKSTARYGDPSGQHAVSVVGVHYSRQQRDELSSAYFGTGMKGEERLRVSEATDHRIKRRLYFYASTGKGVAPESDVGTHAHSVTLDNVYDMDVDPLRLYKQPKPGDTYRSPDNLMNDFESAVIDAGFDGYMTREFGKGGAVVLLGTHSVPVQYEGQGVRPETAAAPAPKYSDLQRLKREIAANRALPSGQMTGLEWKRLLMSEMPEVDPRWLDNDALYRKGDLLAGAEEPAPVQFSLVRAAEAKKLDAGKKVTLYRAMTLIDGKLYPPMSAKMSDERGKLALRDPEPVGQWMRAEERPDLVDDEGKFPLKKPGGGTTWALYAPYFHASPTPLNDQFTAAWLNDGVERPQLVTVEVEVPKSELTSGYQAEGSVKKTGPNKWNSGVVASKVPGGREVMLSRYVKIKRVVPDAEVAKKIAAIVKPNRLSIPENTVTPQLRAELEKNGVRISPKGTKGDDIRYSTTRTDTPAFKKWFGDSVVTNPDGSPKVMYHGTARDISEFRPKQANAIFVTDNPNFAGDFAQDSANWISKNEWKPVSGQNVMPLYVRAENPFDPDNRTHLVALQQALGSEWSVPLKIGSTGKEYAHTMSIEDVKNGSWAAIENPTVQEYIRANHDSFYVYEGGNKNLAVFEPTQIKSASGNRGTYDRGDPDIRKSTIRQQADAIKAMTEDERDNLDPYEFGYRGYVLYEAEKMMPKKDGTFKSVNENNSFALWQEADAVVNVGGKPFLATKQEDPDDDADEGLYVWSFSDPEAGGTGTDVQTDWADKTDAVAQLREKLGGVQRSTTRTDPWYYSELARAVDNAPAKVFSTGKQVAAWLQSNSGKLGVKKQEIEATGITDWLQTRDRVTREDVAAYLEQGGVQLTETVLDSPFDEDNPTLPDGLVVIDAKELDSDEHTSAKWYKFAVVDDWNRPLGYGNTEDDAISDAYSGYPEVFTGKNATKFSDYQLPGGENYREWLLTLPSDTAYDKGELTKFQRAMIDKYDTLNWKPLATEQERSEHATIEARFDRRKEQFRSSHFDQPNILAHIRTNERTDADGRRVLFIEEIQSDWAQKGRKEGFAQPGWPDGFSVVKKKTLTGLAGLAGRTEPELSYAFYVRRPDPVWGDADGLTTDGTGYATEERAREVAWALASGGREAVPSAPFVTDTKSWTALALKRMIAHAVEQGFDSVAWTTGEQQAARYDLSKHVGSISYMPVGDGFSVTVWAPNDDTVWRRNNATASEIEDTLGKEIAQKMVAREGAPRGDTYNLSGLDLKVGGEGMKGYYDAIVPQVAKKLGATVGVVTIPARTGSYEGKMAYEEDARQYHDMSDAVWDRQSSKELNRLIDEFLAAEGGLTQPGFTITPAMQGPLPLFSTRRALDGDFSEQDHLVPDLAPWTTDSQLVDLAYIDGKPVRLNVGVDYGKGEGRGAIHMIANAQRDARRTLDQVTDDEGENVVRTVLTALGTYGAVLHKQGGTRYALRLPLAKMTLVLDSKRDHWSIVTSLPTAKNTFGDADWTGRLTFPATEPTDGAAPNSIPVLKNPLDGRSGLGAYKSAKFNATPSAGKSQIVVKRAKRVVAPQLSTTRTMGDSGRTYTPEQIAANKRIGREVEDLTRVERIKKWANKRWTQGLFDQFAPVKELSKSAYMLMRLSKGATGAFEAFMKHGKLKVLADGSTDGDTTGGFVERVLQPLGKEATDFFYWVAAHRAERLAAEGKERLFTPADIAAFKSLANGVTDFDYTLRNGQTTRDRTLIYKDALVNFNEFSKNVMDVAEASGLIDGASRHLWEHEFYVPFYRVMDEKDGGVRGANIKKGVVRQQAFKKLKGGEEKLNDLLDNTLMNFAHLIDASAKNRAAKAALEAAVAVGVAQPVSAHAAPKGSVWYVENGAQKWYSVDDPHLLTAISSLEYVGLRGPMWDALTTSKHWLTVGVTASPFFKVRNLIRDSVHSIGVSDLGYNIGSNLKQGGSATNFTGALKNAGKAAIGMRTDTLAMSQDYVSALAGGGLIRFGTMLEGNEAARTRKLVELGNPAATILNSHSKVQAFYNKLDSAWSAYQELGNQGEEINRMALYNQLIKQGKSHLEASFLARDLMDFSSQGTFDSIRILTQVVPFMNARLQGMYKLGRAAKEDPAKMAIVTGAIAVASLSLLAAFGDDDDWKRRPDWDRDTYWWFKFGGEAYKIPKPFELGAIGTLVERSAELIFDKEMTGKRFKDAVVGLLKGQLAMNPTPQALKPLWDLHANKDSFSGKPIEGMAMERLDPQHRYTSSTSMVARGASVATAGVLSPVQIDHLVRGYFGWIGSTAVATADLAVRAASNEPARPTADWVKIATGGMVADLDSSGSRYVEHMYEQAKEIDQAYGTWRRLLKEGKGAEAREYFEDNKALIVKEKQVAAIKRRESAISEAIRVVERSSRTPDEKRDAINRYRKMQDQTARQLTP